MKTMKMTSTVVMLTMGVPLGAALGEPVGTGFTYQGQLKRGGVPVNDACDLVFSLWDAARPPAQVGPTLAFDGQTGNLPPVAVANGLFTVKLDFGNVFDGNARWLQIGVRCPHTPSGVFFTVLGRQELTPGPYAIFASEGGGVGGNTLDQAYDQGGPGAGRTITADGGAVNIAGPDGLTVNGNVGILVTNTRRSTPAPPSSAELKLRATSMDRFPGFTGIGSLRVDTIPPSLREPLTHQLTLNAETADMPITFETAGVERVRIDPDGNVGIGTTTPEGPLHVHDGSAGAVRAHSRSSAVFERANHNYVTILSPNNTERGLLFGDPENSVNGGIVYNSSAHPDGLGFRTGGNVTRMVVDADGRVGIGTTSPDAWLDVRGGGRPAVSGKSSWIGVFGSHTSTTGSFPGVWGETNSRSNGAIGVYGFATATSGASSGVRGRNASSAGWAGYFVNTSLNGAALYAEGSGAGRDRATLRVRNTEPNQGMAAYITNDSTWATMHIQNDGPGETLWLVNNGGGDLIVARSADRHEFWVDGSGITNARVLRIHGGADLSEGFDVRGWRADEKAAVDSVGDQERRREEAGDTPVPGMVVCIDPDSSGKLMVCTDTYDRRVAGIISGAGGVKPGMLMGQPGSEADGEYPVALTGRVYVWADASSGPIQPGDLLTTSDTPGHAMKVTDHARAQGAVLGKTMSSLASGKGLVLVLVSLQ